MAAPATINNGDVPDATKLMLWLNYLLAGKGISSGTFTALDAAAGVDPFLAILTDTKQIAVWLGDRTLGTNGWAFLGGF